MNIRARVAIFLVAVLLTFVGFNLIATSGADDLLKVGKQAGYEIIANVLAKADMTAHQSNKG